MNQIIYIDCTIPHDDKKVQLITKKKETCDFFHKPQYGCGWHQETIITQYKSYQNDVIHQE